MDKVLHNGAEYTIDEFECFLKDFKESTFSNKSSVYSSIPKLLPFLNKESKVLDFGSGLGQVSAYIYEEFNSKVDAVEPYNDWREKSKLIWKEKLKYDIDFINLDNFDFPKEKYDLVISTAVIEHVHNPGMYLQRINDMLKNNGFLLIGLPNANNIRMLTTQLRYGEKKLINHSKRVVNNYDKPNDHIHSWDTYHFTILLGSCGFEIEKYVPTGGIPLPFTDSIPIIGKILPNYIYSNIPFLNRLSYGMYYLTKKVRNNKIGVYD